MTVSPEALLLAIIGSVVTAAGGVIMDSNVRCT